MPIQDFNIYTAKGYAGDLVDSGPRTVQTGILVPNAAGISAVGFGKAVLRQITGTKVPRGIELGGSANVYAITQREYNHEASTRPAKDGDWAYKEGESVSLIKQGYLYLKLTGTTAVAAGDVLNVVEATGEFTADAVTTGIVATVNVTADEAALVGEVFKARIDIIHTTA